MPRKTDVIIIGGGQAGLATSRCLADWQIDHVVLERGEIGQRWRTERWKSLRLLTPNWMTHLPGKSYQGSDPDGFMAKDDVTRFLVDYSTQIAAPVQRQTRVLSLRRQGEGYLVMTTRGNWQAKAVVIATGACDIPHVPQFARSIDPGIAQISLKNYKSSTQVTPGGVLVVGASASGVQIASELQAAGRDVTLAAGRHARLPRRYRGQDIMVWLNRAGILHEARDPDANVEKLARNHSLQLVGSRIGKSLSLATFQAQGGRITGRMTGAEGHHAEFADTLQSDIHDAEARQSKILRRIDSFIDTHHVAAPAPDRIDPVRCPAAPSQMDLRRAGIRTVIWATGYRRDYGWLDIPVLTPAGEIFQHGGVTPVRGLYTMGLPFMRRCNSTFIDGVGQDARDISREIAFQLGQAVRTAA